ncbi:MAG: tetratricopeptide repeat protein [Spirochaetes bacterium]|nr:tetratricopeptide repeat protein [Spirochaetota bacterium]
MKSFRGTVIIAIAAVLVMAPTDAGQRMRILVLPFKNAGTPQYSWIAAGMTDTVVADLQRLKSVNVFTEEERKKAFDEIELGMTGIMREEDAVKAGNIMGASAIFTGSFTVAGNAVRVVAKLTDVATTKISRSRKIDGTLEGIFNLQDRIVTALMEEAGAMELPGIDSPEFTEEEMRGARRVHVPSLKVFELYSRALEKFEENPREALSLAVQAARLDPRYADALTLAGSLSSGTGDTAAAEGYYARAQSALEREGLKGSPQYALLLHSRAVMEWNRGENEASVRFGLEATRIWEALGRRESSSYASTLTTVGSAYRNLGELERGLRLTEEARGMMERAGLAKSSQYSWTLSNLGVLRLMMKQYGEALRLNDRAMANWERLGMKRSMGYAFTYSQNGSIRYAMGDYGNALTLLRQGMAQCEELGLDNTVQYAYFSWNAANCHWMQGRYCDGLPYMEKAARVFKSLKSAVAPQAERSLRDFRKNCGR